MTLTPERLEELDFPTPEVESPPDDVVGFEVGGVIHTVPASELVMTRLGPLLPMTPREYAARDWDCYCSPSRGQWHAGYARQSTTWSVMPLSGMRLGPVSASAVELPALGWGYPAGWLCWSVGLGVVLSVLLLVCLVV